MKPRQMPLVVPVSSLKLSKGLQVVFEDGTAGIVVSTRPSFYTASYGVVAWVQVQGETYQRAVMSNDSLQVVT